MDVQGNVTVSVINLFQRAKKFLNINAGSTFIRL